MTWEDYRGQLKDMPEELYQTMLREMNQFLRPLVEFDRAHGGNSILGNDAVGVESLDP